MRIASFALIIGFTSLASAAELRPFAITCNQLVTGPAETIKSSLRIDWDGSVLTSTEQDVDEQLDKHVEKALGSRLLASDTKDDVRISIYTGTHAEKGYRYYTAFHFVPEGSSGTLIRMFSTVDKDGFLIDASAIEYAGCRIKFESKPAI